MLTVFLVSLFILLFISAYRFYSPVVAAKLGVDTERPTPAHTRCDGIDYLPARTPVLFGHHFASIAGAAPIVGPVIAAAYGWGPVILWILLGGIFLGAVHDFAAVIVSARHDGKSIGEVIDRQIGRAGKLIFLFFIWATLVLLISVFLVMAGETFAVSPVVATSSICLIVLAVLFGLASRRFSFSLLRGTLVGIAILFFCMAMGWSLPLALDNTWWIRILTGYIFAASVVPVWLLLQPRDYLSSLLLYLLLGLGVIGIFVARPAVDFPFFVAWNAPLLGPLFPMLFVTVACGAISGFHSIVASGTTAKQLANERSARPIGYGAMLVECMVAVLALCTVMRLTRTGYSASLQEGGPIALFSRGIGAMISATGISAGRGMEFAALVVSAFVLTTLDTATRLSRLAWQEFFAPAQKGERHIFRQILCHRFTGTLATVAAASVLAYSDTWQLLWPIFGSANQLLAALTLLAVTLWLRGLGRDTIFFKIPMLIMFTITLSALGLTFYQNMLSGNYILSFIIAALFILGLTLPAKSARMTQKSRS